MHYGCAVKADGSVVGLTQVRHLLPIFTVGYKPISKDSFNQSDEPKHVPHLDVYGEAEDLETFKSDVRKMVGPEPDSLYDYHIAEKLLARNGYIAETDGY